jgi:hypothetical protein
MFVRFVIALRHKSHRDHAKLTREATERNFELASSGVCGKAASELCPEGRACMHWWKAHSKINARRRKLPYPCPWCCSAKGKGLTALCSNFLQNSIMEFLQKSRVGKS